MEKKFYVAGTVSETEGIDLYYHCGEQVFHLTETEAKDFLEYCREQDDGEDDKLYEVSLKEVL